MKDRTLTKVQRRMRIMRTPLLDDNQVKKLLQQARNEAVLIEQLKKVGVPPP